MNPYDTINRLSDQMVAEAIQNPDRPMMEGFKKVAKFNEQMAENRRDYDDLTDYIKLEMSMRGRVTDKMISAYIEREGIGSVDKWELIFDAMISRKDLLKNLLVDLENADDHHAGILFINAMRAYFLPIIADEFDPGAHIDEAELRMEDR